MKKSSGNSLGGSEQRVATSGVGSSPTTRPKLSKDKKRLRKYDKEVESLLHNSLTRHIFTTCTKHGLDKLPSRLEKRILKAYKIDKKRKELRLKIKGRVL